MSNIAEQINILIEVQSVEREILQAGRQLDALHDEAALIGSGGGRTRDPGGG
jgi:hypothetical protein